MKKYILYTLLIIFTAITGCSKDKKMSKRLGGESWQITAMTIDGSAQTELPVFNFQNCDIYKESCRGTMSLGLSQGDEPEFIWQLRDKGKAFEISNQSQGEAAVLLWQVSGTYKVVSLTKTEFDISSTVTEGYPGVLVHMVMKKIKG
jgi:hypothetical protein